MSVVPMLMTEAGPDLTISPAVGGKTEWTFAVDGDLSLSTAGQWTITPQKIIGKTVKIWGAGGVSRNASDAIGGGGGCTEGTLILYPTQSYVVVVGSTGSGRTAGTFGGGGTGGNAASGRVGGAGGGYSGIFTSSVTLANAVAIAGGGGGSARNDATGSHDGGAGGGSTGQDGGNFGLPATAGKGGTQTAGGAAGTPSDANSTLPTAGSALQGGNGGVPSSSSHAGGGAGGGGYYGGGGGVGGGNNNSGGGGGSGFIGGLVNATTTTGNFGTPANSSDPDRGTSGNADTAGKFIIKS